MVWTVDEGPDTDNSLLDAIEKMSVVLVSATSCAMAMAVEVKVYLSMNDTLK